MVTKRVKFSEAGFMSKTSITPSTFAYRSTLTNQNHDWTHSGKIEFIRGTIIVTTIKVTKRLKFSEAGFIQKTSITPSTFANISTLTQQNHDWIQSGKSTTKGIPSWLPQGHVDN
jgi:hypothetical protein